MPGTTQTRRCEVVETTTPFGASTTTVHAVDQQKTDVRFQVDARNAPRSHQVIRVTFEWAALEEVKDA